MSGVKTQVLTLLLRILMYFQINCLIFGIWFIAIIAAILPMWGIGSYVADVSIFQGISIEYVLGIQYFEKVLVLGIQYILRRSIGKSINTFRLEIQYPILFSRIFQSFQSKNSKFSRKI